MLDFCIPEKPEDLQNEKPDHFFVRNVTNVEQNNISGALDAMVSDVKSTITNITRSENFDLIYSCLLYVIFFVHMMMLVQSVWQARGAIQINAYGYI